METIILNTPGELEVTETSSPPDPGPGEVLLKVHHVGICGTDLHAYEGTQAFFDYPRILGHELGLEVVDVGSDVRDIQPGESCTVAPYLSCGNCVACRRGKTNCCTTLKTLGVHTDGGMRQHIVLPADIVLPSHELNLEQLALVETIGIGAHAVGRAKIEPGEFVLIVGAGPIGLGIMEFTQISGGRIILMELSKSRIEFSQLHYQVEGVLDSPDDAVENLEALCRGDLPTVVFDATGSRRSMESSFAYVANGGRLVFVGITTEEISFVGSESHRREMTLLNSRNATRADLIRVMDHMARGDINTDNWITHRATPATLSEQFPDWLDPDSGVVKALLSM